LLTEPNTPKTRLELATALNTNPDSHGFIYGFNNIQKMGLVHVVGTVPKVKKVKSKKMTAPEITDEKPVKKARTRCGKLLFKLTEKAFIFTAQERVVEGFARSS